jgi:hypothetical protein
MGNLLSDDDLIKHRGHTKLRYVLCYKPVRFIPIFEICSMGAHCAFQRIIHSGSFYLRDSAISRLPCPFGANLNFGLFPEFSRETI